VFLDHMMPELDGVETAGMIRALGTEYARSIPIIALTANAIAGNEQMFLECGFQAFLSKPIDIIRLDTVIRRWVRDESREEPRQELSFFALPPAGLPEQNMTIEMPEFAIPGIDAIKGLSLFGDDWETYLSVLRSYAASVPAVVERLRGVSGKALPDYAIAVHSLKGASASIGAGDIREAAASMESMAKAGCLSEVLARNKAFLKDVENLVNCLQAWLLELDAGLPKPRLYSPDRSVLNRLRQSCENYDMDGIDRAMHELENAGYDTDGSLITWLREKIDVLDFSEAAARLAEYEEV
jgi:CheY-like chemotaxis protein